MITAYFLPVVGGAETQAFRLAKALSSLNVNVFVITRKLKGIKNFEKIEGIPVHRLFTLGSGKIASLFFMFSSFIFLINNRKRYQIIHSHLPSSPAITAVVAGKLLGKKTMVKFACSGPSGNIQTSAQSSLGRVKLRLLMRYADVFVCPSKDVEKELVEYGFDREKIAKIPNGVDTNLFRPGAVLEKRNLRKHFNFSQLPVVAYAGRLELRKRLDTLLKAWQSVTKTTRACLLIIGDGSERDRLDNLVRKLGINDFVRFTGEVSNVHEYLKACDCFVFPSSSEGLPNAVLEAMATGLPVVATRIGGIEEVIQNGKTGILISLDNSDELATAVITLLSRPELGQRLGCEARRTVQRNYSMETVAKRYRKVYEEMLNEICVSRPRH